MITNSIVCHNAKIGLKCKVTSCQIGAAYDLLENSYVDIFIYIFCVCVCKFALLSNFISEYLSVRCVCDSAFLKFFFYRFCNAIFLGSTRKIDKTGAKECLLSCLSFFVSSFLCFLTLSRKNPRTARTFLFFIFKSSVCFVVNA